MNPQLRRLLLDLGPLLLFFAAFKYAGFYVATGVFMVAMLVALGIGWSVERKLSPMPLFTAAMVVVFGGLTIWLQDDTFIKLKPTIVNTLFAVILGGGLVLFKKPLLKPLFGAAFKLTDEGWYQLTMRWTVFFFVLAIVNEVMWRNFPTDTWIASKMFLSFPLTMVFAFLQIPLLKKYWDGDDNPFARGS